MAEENDIVLIHFEDEPLVFSRIETISPDVKRGWYHVKLLMLQVPVQVVTWILRDTYIDGEEFTMNGKRMRLEKVVCPEAPATPEDSGEKEGADQKIETRPETGKGNIISLADLKKK